MRVNKKPTVLILCGVLAAVLGFPPPAQAGDDPCQSQKDALAAANSRYDAAPNQLIYAEVQKAETELRACRDGYQTQAPPAAPPFSAMPAGTPPQQSSAEKSPKAEEKGKAPRTAPADKCGGCPSGTTCTDTSTMLDSGPKWECVKNVGSTPTPASGCNLICVAPATCQFVDVEKDGKKEKQPQCVAPTAGNSPPSADTPLHEMFNYGFGLFGAGGIALKSSSNNDMGFTTDGVGNFGAYGELGTPGGYVIFRARVGGSVQSFPGGVIPLSLILGGEASVAAWKERRFRLFVGYDYEGGIVKNATTTDPSCVDMFGRPKTSDPFGRCMPMSDKNWAARHNIRLGLEGKFYGLDSNKLLLAPNGAVNVSFGQGGLLFILQAGFRFGYNGV